MPPLNIGLTTTGRAAQFTPTAWLRLNRNDGSHEPEYSLKLATEPPLLDYRPDLSVYDILTGGAVK
jgi:hypothetical protein